MQVLGALADGSAAEAALSPLVAGYRSWLADQRTGLGGLVGERRDAAEQLLHLASIAADRMERGIAVAGGRCGRARCVSYRESRRVRRPLATSRTRRQLRNAALAGLSARLHPAEPPRHRRPGQSRARVRGSSLLPDRRRQDRGVSRPRRVHHGSATAPQPGRERPRGSRRQRHHALHLATADPRSARARGRIDLRAGAGAPGETPPAGSANGRSRSVCGWARPGTPNHLGDEGRRAFGLCARQGEPVQEQPAREADTRSDGELSVVWRGFHPGLLHVDSGFGEADRSPHRVRELAVRVLRRPSATDRGGRRAALPAPARVPHRHRGQVRLPAVGRGVRCASGRRRPV